MHAHLRTVELYLRWNLLLQVYPVLDHLPGIIKEEFAASEENVDFICLRVARDVDGIFENKFEDYLSLTERCHVPGEFEVSLLAVIKSKN